jgi:hypothetical protein
MNPSASDYHQVYTGSGTKNLIPSPTFPDPKYLYSGINRGDGTTGTLHASNIHSGAGIAGEDLSSGILVSGHTVDDVTGSATGGGSTVIVVED